MGRHMKNLSLIQDIEKGNVVQKTLSSYVEVFINEDSTANYVTVNDDYFFRNNEWDAKFIAFHVFLGILSSYISFTCFVDSVSDCLIVQYLFILITSAIVFTRQNEFIL